MEKVTDNWFKERGWNENIYKDVIERPESVMKMTTVSKRMVYTCMKDNKFARYEHTYEVTTDKYNRQSVSNWYSFYCSGNGFTIENRVAYRKFCVNQIEAALTVVGL